MNRHISLALAVVAAATLTACQCGAPGVSCNATSDCVNPDKPICSTSLNLCVECLDDAVCAPGFVCNASGTCEAGCRTEQGRCELGQFCRPGANACVACLTDAQCGPGRLCRNDVCIDGCSATNPTCAPGFVCDVQSEACVQCLANSQCTNPQLPLCDPASKTCVGCLGNIDCRDPAKPVCDPVPKTCVGCLGDGDCATGKVCRNQVCVAGCNTGQPCPAGQVCTSPTNGTCVQCTSDSQCSGTTPRCDTQANRCVACLPGGSDNCPTGQACRSDFICERGCKSGADCPSGVCQPDRSCATCSQDSHCAAGSVCTNGTCVAACSASAPCGSGRDCCNGRCIDKQNDARNCGMCGTVCALNQTCCGGSCQFLNTAAHCGLCATSCGTGEDCCNNACTSTTTLTNCGGCNIVCAADQFCDGTVCRNQVFPEFCANQNVYAIYDGIQRDNAATDMLASTIQQYCSAQTTIQYGPQTNAQWVEQTTGALLLGGGSTVVTAGGPFPNKPVKWLETTRLSTKVYFASNNQDTFYFRARLPTNNVGTVVTNPANQCTPVPSNVTPGTYMCNAASFPSSCAPGRDLFVVELVTDPTSATLALISYGLCTGGYGTRAGAWYWANVMLPNRMSYPNSWYVYEWTDIAPTDGGTPDYLPDPGDTFTQRATGR
ncbi:MAG: hypothetical protein JNG84_10200 [Archangium sp.]|nr:hypothetical protein [Archangium sp.]